MRGVGRCLPADRVAYPTTPYPLRWAWPGTHPTPAAGCWRYGSCGASAQTWRGAKVAFAHPTPRSSPLAGAGPGGGAGQPWVDPGSPAGSTAAATADPEPEAEADWLAPMGKRFPLAEKKPK